MHDVLAEVTDIFEIPDALNLKANVQRMLSSMHRDSTTA